MIRSTTNSVLKGYRYNLQRSSYTVNKARNTVLTGRNFNTFADDPATAARCFQLRRSFQRTNTQYAVGESVVRKYEQAWSSLESVIQDVNTRMADSAYTDVLRGLNDPTASGRNALGQSLTALSKSIVQTMNCRYGDNFVFAGADGLNVPFSWNGEGGLLYRGVAVDAAVPEVERSATGDPLLFLDDGTQTQDAALATSYKTVKGDLIKITDYEAKEKASAALKYMVDGEQKFVDIGLGLQEDEKGGVIGASVFNTALQGIHYLGYGADEDGDPKNVVSLIARMGAILQACDAKSGAFASDEQRAEFQRLAGKLETSAAVLSDRYVELDTQAGFVKGNQKQLEGTAYTLQEQFLGIEDVDPAEAISAFSWAQYCYNTALKVGNSILSQSLMDYINN